MSPLLSCRGVDLAVAEDDAAAGQVVGAELHHHAVLGEDPDVVLAHLAADVGENLVPVAQLHAEHGVGQCVCNFTIKSNCLFCHTFKLFGFLSGLIRILFVMKNRSDKKS